MNGSDPCDSSEPKLLKIAHLFHVWISFVFFLPPSQILGLKWWRLSKAHISAPNDSGKLGAGFKK
jgi:hypothetical protein